MGRFPSADLHLNLVVPSLVLLYHFALESVAVPVTNIPLLFLCRRACFISLSLSRSFSMLLFTLSLIIRDAVWVDIRKGKSEWLTCEAVEERR